MEGGSSVQKFELDHIRHDAVHCLAPGLFRALKRGERRTTKLDIVYEYGDGVRVEFSGPEPLGADDLRVLQGLVALAGLEGKPLRSIPKTPVGIALRELLEPRWEAATDEAIALVCSYRRLAREIGYARIECSRPIKASIERLWKVSIIVQSGQQRRGFRLLADYQTDDGPQGIHIALNPLLAGAVLGTDRHIRIDMVEVRKLKNESTRLLHQRLCAMINPGSALGLKLTTLCAYIFTTEANAATTRKRLTRTRKAVEDLREIGWTVTEYVKDKYKIGRPRINCHRP